MHDVGNKQRKTIQKLSFYSKNAIEYGQERPQPKITDHPTAPQGRDTQYQQPHSSNDTIKVKATNSCADLESFVRGGQNLITFFLVYEGMDDPNTTVNRQPSARHRNAIKWRFAGAPMMAKH